MAGRGAGSWKREDGSVTIWVIGVTLFLVLLAATLFEMGRWLHLHSQLTGVALATADAVAGEAVCESDLRAGWPWRADRPPKLVSTAVGTVAERFAAAQPEWDRLQNPTVTADLDASGTVVTVTVTAETGPGLLTGRSLDGIEISGQGAASAMIQDVPTAVVQQLQTVSLLAPSVC